MNANNRDTEILMDVIGIIVIAVGTAFIIYSILFGGPS